MRKLTTAIRLIKKERGNFLAALLKNLNFLFPDKLYLQLMFRYRMGYKLDLKNPKTFNEKLQWLKLHNRNPLYTTLVDKYAVKNWMAEKLGEEHVVPTLGVWDNANDIDFDKLPNQFVLKTTHGSGGDIVLCKDKSEFDIGEAVRHLNRSMKKNVYKVLREWPYKNVPPRIIAEPFLDDNGHVPVDYKVYCFNGAPYKVMLCLDRDKDEPTKFYSFDFDWNFAKA
jgi:hypothetical protein